MGVPYDVFTNAFLDKITEYSFLDMLPPVRSDLVDGYMKRAIQPLKRVCEYDISNIDDDEREILVDIPDGDLHEIVDIVSEGMIVQWLKQYLYKQELMEMLFGTKDFTMHSPAELLKSIKSSYDGAYKKFTQDVREYSYNTGDLGDLHI